MITPPFWPAAPAGVHGYVVQLGDLMPSRPITPVTSAPEHHHMTRPTQSRFQENGPGSPGCTPQGSLLPPTVAHRGSPGLLLVGVNATFSDLTGQRRLARDVED